MRVVYMWEDGSGVKRVFKVAKPEASHGAVGGSNDGFPEEYRLLEELRHPHIVRVTGLLTKDGRLGYEMFFMKNRDLHELIGNRGARAVDCGGLSVDCGGLSVDCRWTAVDCGGLSVDGDGR